MLTMEYVDSVALVNPIEETGYVAVNMYLDDHGTMKGLPYNLRASMVAKEAGKAIRVIGDAWIARLYDNQEDFQRMDFTLDDLKSDTDWMKKAKELNLKSAGRDAKKEMKDLMDLASKKSALKQCGMGYLGCETPTRFRCSRCQGIWYCSQDHQKKDWTRHKQDCKKKEKPEKPEKQVTQKD